MQRRIYVAPVLALFAYACAPVASSVPKTTRHTDVDVVAAKPETVISPDSRLDIVDLDEYPNYEKGLDSKYVILTKYFSGDSDSELEPFLSSRVLKDIDLPASVKKAELRVVLVVSKAAQSKVLVAAEKTAKLTWFSARKPDANRFAFSVEKDGFDDKAWDQLGKKLSQVTVLYRPLEP